MKKTILISSFYIITFFNVFAAQVSVDSIFNAANQAYIKKDFESAVNLYETLTSNGYRSSELFFNTGNAYYKLGNFAKAILYFEKAKLIDPDNSDIDFNLSKAKTYVIDKIEIIPDFFISSWFKTTILKLSSNSWAIIAVGSFIFFGLLVLIYLLVGSAYLRKLSFYLGIIALVVSFVTLVFSFKTKSLIEKSNSAIVMSPTVTVKSSPDNESTDAFIIHEGTKVFVIRSLNGWNEIKLSDGKQGWLETSTIEKI